MFSLLRSLRIAAFILFATVLSSQAADGPATKRIVLVAGETAKVDVVGHHDYLEGCRCLEVLLRQTAGVETVRVNEGWPDDRHVFVAASAHAFYTDGDGEQAFLLLANRHPAHHSVED